MSDSLSCREKYTLKFSYCKCYYDTWYTTGNHTWTMTDCNLDLIDSIIIILTIVPIVILLV